MAAAEPQQAIARDDGVPGALPTLVTAARHGPLVRARKWWVDRMVAQRSRRARRTLEAMPELWRLTQSKHSRVFVDQSSVEIIEAILNAVAAIVDAIGNDVCLVSKSATGDQCQGSDQQTCFCCVLYIPCIHVSTP